MNKKGLFGISEAFSIFLLVIVFVGFWLTFEIADSFGSDKEEILSYELEGSKEYGFVFLKTPVEVNNIKMTFADLIVESVENEDYTILENSLNKEFENSEIYWSINIKNSKGNLLKKLTRDGWISKGGQRRDATEIKIPKYSNGEIKILISLTSGELFNQAIADYSDPSKIPRGSIGSVY